jgi:hypothetical protein
MAAAASHLRYDLFPSQGKPLGRFHQHGYQASQNVGLPERIINWRTSGFRATNVVQESSGLKASATMRPRRISTGVDPVIPNAVSNRQLQLSRPILAGKR